jgi:flagellar L-ring protein precursor FlgH
MPSYSSAVFLLLLALGCAYNQPMPGEMSKDMVDYVPSASEQQQGYPEPAYIDLFGDKRASKLNDIVVVNVTEQAASTYQAGTTTNRETGLSGDFTTNPGGRTYSGDMNAAHDYTGTGTTQRGGTFVTQVVCVVRDVYPNGNLFIEGRRRIHLNDEDQVMLLRGVVRPEDIESNNQISSILVANLAIAYEGKGLIGNKQRPGFLSGVLDKIWPF